MLRIVYLYVHGGKNRKVKMEFIDSVLYQVIAKYMEIDGREYVMEMINCLDDELILDPQGKKPSAEKNKRIPGSSVYRCPYRCIQSAFL